MKDTARLILPWWIFISLFRLIRASASALVQHTRLFSLKIRPSMSIPGLDRLHCSYLTLGWLLDGDSSEESCHLDPQIRQRILSMILMTLAAGSSIVKKLFIYRLLGGPNALVDQEARNRRDRFWFP